jgi:hypothetical protein
MLHPRTMKQSLLHKRTPILICAIALLAALLPVALVVMQVKHFTVGLFIYPVDDAFIHLQLAKNLAAHGTWGINAGTFGSASSSLLYTLILSGLCKIFGPALYLPLAVNAIVAVFLLLAVHRWLRAQGLGAGAQLLALLLVVFFAPVPILVLSGMEHTLQCLFSFLFLSRFSDWMAQQEGARTTRRLPIDVLLWAVLTATIRYEGLFLVAAACLVLAWRKRWLTAVQLGIIAALPAILFGIYSLSKGSYFLPNSVLIKSEAAQFSLRGLVQSFGRILIEKFTMASAGITLLATQRLLLLLPLIFLAFVPFIRRQRSYGYFIVLLLFATVAHLAFADTGKFYRYEAYLVMCAVLITVVILVRAGAEVLPERRHLCLLLFVFLFFMAFPLVLRSTAAFSKAKRACINIYEQQYQMAQFVHRYYNNDGLAANDIGAVSYFTNTRLLDLWGLASIEVARSKKGGYWTAPFLDSLSREKNTKLAIVYDSWIGQSLPPGWKKVAAWRIPDNVVCGDDLVSFYAVDTSAAPQLKKNLQEYRASLPADVQVTDYP